MILNNVEKVMMNNPVRAMIQKQLEARILLRLGGEITGGKVLEVGCGRGEGIRLIKEVFQAGEVDAFDLDPDMVERARKRTASFSGVRIFTGDAEHIPAPDGAYSAVFDFGIIHHIPLWENAIAEIHRVLAPKGRFYAEEVYEAFIMKPIFKLLLEHPLENRFTHRTFREALEKTGFVLVGETRFANLFGWFVVEKAGS